MYTKHAEERIKMRGIEKKDVEMCLREPEVVEKRNEIFIAQRKVKEKVLRVVYKTMGNTYIIITVYLTTKKKYRVGEKK